MLVAGPLKRIVFARFSGPVVTTRPERMGPRRGGVDATPTVVTDMLERIVFARFSGPVVADRPKRMRPRRCGPGAVPALVTDSPERIVFALFSASVVTTRSKRMGRADGARARSIPLIRSGLPATTRGRNSSSLIRLDASVTSAVPRPARPRSVRGSL